MANKQQVYDAFYEGVSLVIEQILMTGGGICPSSCEFDIAELKEFATRNEKEEILRWLNDR